MINLINCGEWAFPVHQLQGKVPDGCSVPQGRQKPHSFDHFCQVLSPACLSRRECGPCTKSWGNSCNGSGRSWLSFGSTLPPACRNSSSVFGTKSRVLEENVGGLGSGEGCERQGMSFGPSPRRTQPPMLSLGCPGESSPFCWCMELPGYMPCMALEGLFNLLS